MADSTSGRLWTCRGADSGRGSGPGSKRGVERDGSAIHLRRGGVARVKTGADVVHVVAGGKPDAVGGH